MANGITKLEHLVNPQVMADMISAELKNKIKLLPLAVLDTTLQGQAGDTVTVPKWDYIGDAEDITEGEAISITQMSKTETTMKIKQAGKGVEITDKAVLCGYGDPFGEANQQIVMAIANKVDTDLVKELEKAKGKSDVTGGKAKGLLVENLMDAKDVFADEDDYKMYLVVNPSNATQLRKDAGKNWISGTELGAKAIQSGVYGTIDGIEIIRTNKVEKDTCYLVKENAMRVLLKRDIAIEADRDILKKATIITADEHYGVYLYDTSKVVKITLK